MSIINTNVKALVAQESSRQVELRLATAMERLSTGLRINSAADDAAGLAISERMNAQVRGLGMAIKNANDALSMAQTADGAYGEITAMLQRMRELAVQAATGTMGPLDRHSLQLEINELKTEIENVASKTHFNGIALLDGTARNLTLQIGANQGDTMLIGFESARTKDIGSGLKPALTSTGGDATVFDALAAGDLIINGAMVNASLANDDSLSPLLSEVQQVTVTTATGAGTPSITITGDTGVITFNTAALAGSETPAAVASAIVSAINTTTITSGVSATSSSAVVTITYGSRLGDIAKAVFSNNTATFTSNPSISTTIQGHGLVQRAASAVSKAAAINRVSENSGVYAFVNNTVVQGSSMTAPVSPTTAAAITINGAATTDLSLGTDNATNRAAVVRAINEISAQSGVRAIDSEDDRQGILLIADDGRNINLNLEEGLTSANTGLAAAGNFVGTYSLYSTAGESITIGHQIGSDITGTGLRSGTYQPDMATMVTHERSGSGAAAAGAQTPATAGTTPSNSSGVGILKGDTLVINGIAIDAARTSDDTASLSTTASAKAASAIAIAAAINRKTDRHGVTATPEPNVIRSESATPFVSQVTSGMINLNGVSISISPTSRDAVMSSINASSGQTGVVARSFGEGIELVAEDGRNIVLSASTELSASNLGLAGVLVGAGASAGAASAEGGNVFYSTVRLVSTEAFSLKRGYEGGDNFSRLGFREGTFGGTNTGVKIAAVDVSTQGGAGIAITAIDAALEDVMSAQALSGAYQNRLDAVINVQSEASENLTASRSRIMDADYALEATNLAKAQIVAQAATAMLAQANQSQQTVLQLLQG